ncbi:MAG: transposase [Mediterraneibacter gnavus]
MPEAVVLDLDSTLLEAYGKQEGRAFNFHYQSNGYHPLVCYDGITGDLIKSNCVMEPNIPAQELLISFSQSLMNILADYPEVTLLLRGDSGFCNT